MRQFGVLLSGIWGDTGQSLSPLSVLAQWGLISDKSGQD